MTPQFAHVEANAPEDGYNVYHVSDDSDPQVVAHCYTDWQARAVADEIDRAQPETRDEASMICQTLPADTYDDPRQTHVISSALPLDDGTFQTTRWARNHDVTARRAYTDRALAEEAAIRFARNATERVPGSYATIHNAIERITDASSLNRIATMRCGFYVPERINRLNLLEKIDNQGRIITYLWFRVTASTTGTHKAAHVHAQILTPDGLPIKKQVHLHLSDHEINQIHATQGVVLFLSTLHWICREG